MPISSVNPMFDHLSESSRRDDSYKWSNIGFTEEKKASNVDLSSSYAYYLEMWRTLVRV